MDRLKEIVETLYPRFKGMEDHLAKPEDEFQGFCGSMLNGGISMQIRNEFELWNVDSPNHKYFKEIHNTPHPDDMSGIILRGIQDKFNTEDKQ